MREDFLAFIWKHHYFQKEGLQTTQGKTLQILKVGEENSNAGPDFFNTQIILDGQKWVGTAELHVRSSDWYVHGHEKDDNYNAVILHVVWEDDAPIFRKDNSVIATLELSKFVDQSLLQNYNTLFAGKEKWINCEHQIVSVDTFLLENWLERLYFERLEQKGSLILEVLDQSKNDWEAVLFRLLTKNFGLTVNGEAFYELARDIDFSIIRKEAVYPNQLDALLLGQAGLLHDEIEEPYYRLLQDAYRYQVKKYKLITNNNRPVAFFRLRPNNFPTIRLAQLAALYHKHQNLFSKIMEAKELKTLHKLFDVAAPSFWDTHYTFKAKSKKRSKRLTRPFIDLLLINTIIPLKFIYQKNRGRFQQKEILHLIDAINPEKNSIIEKFTKLGVKANSAFFTQSLLQLKNEYCKRHRCMHCAIGNKLLTKK